ncbi:MAG TPA: hypothetical protein VJG32_17435 [Anaerolineae bacterium]|nr:hypothetical protein [Anaerolineae bacterium]
MGDESWKNRTMVMGGLLGTLIGVGAALMYVRAEEEAREKAQTHPPTRKGVPLTAIVPIAIGVLGVLRQISHLAERE